MKVRVASSLVASALFTMALLATGCGCCCCCDGEGSAAGVGADLSLSKSVSDATPNVGDTITFTITLTNSGPDAATNVHVQDLLPVGLAFVGATPSQGSYDDGSGIWTVSSVAVGTPETLVILATVLSPSLRTNSATIVSADQLDPDPADNTASATETPQQADLSLSKSVSDATPNVGDTITFTITLTNSGPDVATNVEVQDALPVGLAFVSADSVTYDPSTGVWTVGTAAVGSQTLHIVATVVSAIPQTNTATIVGVDQFDPDAGNNAAGATETPQQADLSLIKIVSDPTPIVGDTITFTITLTDNGPDVATNVTVQDLLPIGLTFVSADSINYDASTGFWTVGTVAVGATQTLNIVATVVSASPQTNTATITSADQFDPITGNNADSATETPSQP